MTTIVKGEHRKLTLRQRRGRAVNAVADVLRKKLLVPNIYLEPHSHPLAVDVLAVDRAGSGDLHAVQVKLENDFKMEPGKKPANPKAINERNREWWAHFRKKMGEIRGRLMSLPAHYRYLAIEKDSWDSVMGELGDLYSPDGIGRIGIIAINDHGEDPPSAEIVITPERFRVDGAKLSKIEKNLINNKKVRPDIEVRI
jgi:hypothetical protein